MMHGNMHVGDADHEQIREIMHRLGDIFDLLGYSKVLEDIEGSGAIGKAVQNPRTVPALKAIDEYLKGIGQELLAEPPSKRRANAIAALKGAFAGIQSCIR